MARPDTNHEEKKAQIIRIATGVFSRYGYEGTTNKLIAEEIRKETGTTFTPALIYHYFGSKDELFSAIMRQFPVPQELAKTILDSMAEPPEVFFRVVASTFVELTSDTTTASLIKMIWTEASRHPELARIMAQDIVPTFVLPTIQYIAIQMEQGRIKPGNPVTYIFHFFGPMLQRIMIFTMGGDRYVPFPIPEKEEFIESIVSVFLTGVLAPDYTPADGNHKRNGIVKDVNYGTNK